MEGAGLEGEGGHSGKEDSRTGLLWQASRRVCANSPPLFPYHLSPEGSRLVERTGVEANMLPEVLLSRQIRSATGAMPGEMAGGRAEIAP